MGLLLLKIDQLVKAEELYNTLLEQTSGKGKKVYYYHQLGYIKHKQGDYQKAIWYYEQTHEILEKTFPSNHPDLAICCSSIGLAYNAIREYAKALPFYEKAFNIERKTLPPNHPDLATSYGNIESLYRDMGEYAKALSFHEKSTSNQSKNSSSKLS